MLRYLLVMQMTRTAIFSQRIRTSLSGGFAAPIAVLAIFVLQIIRGIWLLPEGYDGTGVLNTVLSVLLAAWVFGMFVRCTNPTSRLATSVVAISLFGLLTVLSSLATAANAIGSGDYVDPWLIAIDQKLFPFYDWKAVALELPNHPQIYWIFNFSYNSIMWQPLVFLAVASFFQSNDLGKFVTSWALGLLGCILPFHWLPAVSPMLYHKLVQSDLPGHDTALPWTFFPVLEGMRDGTIRALELHCLTGMVTVPSFHACAATILAWAFWRYRSLRWPFLGLNVVMALAAAPVGSHYIIDVVAGITVGSLAVAGAAVLCRRSPQSSSTLLWAGPMTTLLDLLRLRYKSGTG